jgi:hypothetical protein
MELMDPFLQLKFAKRAKINIVKAVGKNHKEDKAKHTLCTI